MEKYIRDQKERKLSTPISNKIAAVVAPVLNMDYIEEEPLQLLTKAREAIKELKSGKIAGVCKGTAELLEQSSAKSTIIEH